MQPRASGEGGHHRAPGGMQPRASGEGGHHRGPWRDAAESIGWGRSVASKRLVEGDFGGHAEGGGLGKSRRGRVQRGKRRDWARDQGEVEG